MVTVVMDDGTKILSVMVPSEPVAKFVDAVRPRVVVNVTVGFGTSTTTVSVPSVPSIMVVVDNTRPVVLVLVTVDRAASTMTVTTPLAPVVVVVKAV